MLPYSYSFPFRRREQGKHLLSSYHLHAKDAYSPINTSVTSY